MSLIRVLVQLQHVQHLGEKGEFTVKKKVGGANKRRRGRCGYFPINIDIASKVATVFCFFLYVS